MLAPEVGNYDEVSNIVGKGKVLVLSASFAESTGCVPCAGNVWVAKNPVDLARVGKVKCVVAFRTHISALSQALAQ
jgi:hypothetical protein